MEWILTQLNTMGKVFVGLTAPMLLSSTILIGFVLLVESVLRGRVRAGLRYWLVTCVLAYLVLIPLLSFNPPSTHWPTGGGSLLANFRIWGPQTAYAEGSLDASSRVAEPDPTSLTPSRHTHAPLSQPTTGQSGPSSATDRGQEPSQTTSGGAGERPRTFSSETAHRLRGPISWQGIVFLLWVIGVAIVGGVMIRKARDACKRLENVPVANNLMNDILIYCRRRMGVYGTVRLKVGPAGARPAVCGLLRPVILVPRNLAPTLGSRHLRDVLFHQLAHIKRHDLWVNLAQNVLQAVYFYNPLILIVNAAIRRLREEAADETVLATIGDPDHRYTQRLNEVETITLRDPPPSLYLIGIA
ncbi:MAG TPA: M56 family metallopeptidase [Sedimentisphaerales bacterium]|nr:M56 family metallopeptidase [Sedimentisphaerales bacterium]